jgi:kynureninase
MHLQPEFVPRSGADGWQVSNPPILSMAALKASLAIFDEVGMEAVRAKSETLTAYLQYLIDQMPSGRYEVITPREPRFRGCQLSILVHHRPQELFEAIKQEGVVCDFRQPNVIRVAPVPLYNTYRDVWAFAQVLSRNV